jgi:hypothetical protein
MKSIVRCLGACAVLFLVACGSASSNDEASGDSEVNSTPKDGANEALDLTAQREAFDAYLRGDNSPKASPGGHWRVVAYSTNGVTASPTEVGGQHIVFTHMSEGGGEASMVTRFYDGDPRMPDVGNGYSSRGTFKLDIHVGEGDRRFSPVLFLDETRTSPGGLINVKTTYVVDSPTAVTSGRHAAGDVLFLSTSIPVPNSEPPRMDMITLELVRDAAPTYCAGFTREDEPDSYCAGQMVSISVPNTQWCPTAHACVAHQCQPSCLGR